jgi:hypothetical protein
MKHHHIYQLVNVVREIVIYSESHTEPIDALYVQNNGVIEC